MHLLLAVMACLVAAAAGQIKVKSVPLKNSAQPGSLMPVVGLGVGTYYVLYPNGTWGEGAGEKWTNATAEAAVLAYLKLGGRRVDTSLRWYHDLGGVGSALAKTDVPRSEIFITGKVDEPYGYQEVLDSIEKQLGILNTTYLDLVLQHWAGPIGWNFETTALDTTAVFAQACGTPAACRVGTYKGMLEAMARGWVRAVGVANYEERHLKDLTTVGLPLPAVVQIEYHPYWHEDDYVKSLQARNITVNSYSPLGAPDYMASLVPLKWPRLPLEEENIIAIAGAVGRTPAQVVQRWQLNKDIVINPRSLDPDHMSENLAVFDFDLTPEQMASIDATVFPRRNKVCPDPFIIA